MASKVIIVTGASRGIGLAIVQYLLRNSHKCFLVSRSAKELENLKTQFPSQVEYLAADLNDFQNAPKVMQLAVKAFGHVDGVVINHGALEPVKRLENANIEDWKNLFDTNYFSAVALVKEAIPLLRATKGKVIFTSSGAAIKPYGAWGAYGSSKAALLSLTQHLALEEPSIASVSVSPGRCDTAMQQVLRTAGKGHMDDAAHADFEAAFEQGALNRPEGPATVIAKLSLDATLDLSGKHVKWDGPELASYRE